MKSAIVLLLCCASAAAQNPWVDGPQAPPPDEDQEALTAPRASDDADEPLDVPDRPPDPTRIAWPDLDERDAPSRFATTLDREALVAAGAQNLADAILEVPGIWLMREELISPVLFVRGARQRHLEVRLDDVPILPSGTYPEFPFLGLMSLAETERLTLAHGPRLGGSVGNGSQGVLEIESHKLADDFREGLPFLLEGRLGFGGPDLEKTVEARAQTGFNRIRAGITAGVSDRDQLRVGRDGDTIGASGGRFGHLGARLSVDVNESARLFARWRAARQDTSPLSRFCLEDRGGRINDCLRADERGHDLLLVGTDLIFGIARVRARAHAQRFGEVLRRSGAGLANIEVTRDDTWRTGALTDLELRFGALSTSARLEVVHDRVASAYTVRSRRSADGDLDDGRQDPALARRVNGSTSTLGRARVGSTLRLSRWTFSGAAEGVAQQLSAGTTSLELGGLLEVSWRPVDEVRLFAALVRSARPIALVDEVTQRDMFGVVVEAQEEDPVAATDLSGEFGGALELDWLRLSGVLWSSTRARVQASGVDASARLRLARAGVTATGTFSTVFVDDGGFLEVGTPQTGVPPPRSTFTVRYAPEDSFFRVFGRTRLLFPQPRLSPTESFDAALCPESEQSPQRDPCRGAAFAAIFDVGVALVFDDRLRLDAVVQNLADVAYRLHGQGLPGGGIGARVVLTVKL